MTWLLLAGPLSLVILLTWVSTWWWGRPRPGLVATLGLVAGVAAVVAGGTWKTDVAEDGGPVVSTVGVVLALNGMAAVVVSAVLLVLSGVVTVVREERRAARPARRR